MNPSGTEPAPNSVLESESWMAAVPGAEWPASPSWADAQLQLRSLMRQWVTECVDRNRSRPWQGSHDEGTFASSWPAFHLLDGVPAAPRYLAQLRNEYLEWSRSHLFHGYWPEQEVHHGPENHLYFQTRLWALDPDDPVGAEVLEDMAHHLGNWIGEVPPWYDWDHHLLCSSFLGTRVVRTDSPHDLNVPDGMRLILVGLAAYRATGNDRYLQWAGDYGASWARAVLDAARPVPLGLHAKLDPAQTDGYYLEVRAKAFGAAPADVDTDLVRVESHVSAGGVDAMLDLWRLTGEDLFLDAAERLLERLVPTLADVYAQPSAALLAKHRRWTGSTRFDDAVLAAVGQAQAEAPLAVFMDSYADWQSHELVGIGRRKDMPLWSHKLANGWLTHAVGPSPAALALAYTITGDDAYLTHAFDLAAVRLQIAMATFSDGREHGCGSQSISAVVRGNGREANYGNVSASLYPIGLGAYEFTGAADPEAAYEHEASGVRRPGLPTRVAAALRADGPNRVRLTLVSRSDRVEHIQVTPLRAADLAPVACTIEPGQTVEQHLPSRSALGPASP